MIARDLENFLSQHFEVMHVVVSRVVGSSPRDVGAEMCVSADAIFGTIGGGQLEYMAIDKARALLTAGVGGADMDVPLGPEIGQCCGGRVDLTLRVMDADERANALYQAQCRDNARPHLYIFGAGHTGRALADLAQHMPFKTILVDDRKTELAQCQAQIETHLSALPEATLRAAPAGSAFVILTHDHALDFLLAAEALMRADAVYVGMIGSKTKRASFENWLLRQDGCSPNSLVCPMGAVASGDKRPTMIAALVLAEITMAFGNVSQPQTIAHALQRYPDLEVRSASTKPNVSIAVPNSSIE